MESKKLNEKDKNFHPKFQVHCLDVVSFPKIWRDDVFFFSSPDGIWGAFFFWCSGDRHERAKLSRLFIRFPPYFFVLLVERECCWHRFLPLPPLPYYSSL